jgi:hypothetical protein
MRTAFEQHSDRTTTPTRTAIQTALPDDGNSSEYSNSSRTTTPKGTAIRAGTAIQTALTDDVNACGYSNSSKKPTLMCTAIHARQALHCEQDAFQSAPCTPSLVARYALLEFFIMLMSVNLMLLQFPKNLACAFSNCLVSPSEFFIKLMSIFLLS